MGGSSDGKTTTVTTPTGGGQPQVIPELQPFIGSVGRIANSAVTGVPTSPTNPAFDPNAYMQPSAMATPNLTPLDLLSGQQISERGLYGIPTPEAETKANTMYSQFMPGGTGVSPAVDAAVEGVRNSVLPVIQNRNAMLGLASSGTEAMQEGQAMAQATAPIYSHGLDLQNQAAQGLNLIGQEQYNRPIESLKEMLAMGDLQRQVETAANTSEYQDFIRRQNLATQVMNPFGSIASNSTPLASTTTAKSSGGGGAFGK